MSGSYEKVVVSNQCKQPLIHWVTSLFGLDFR